MTGLRFLFALLLSGAITLGLFVAVGALNEASAPLVETNRPPKKKMAVLVSQPPKARQALPKAPTALKTTRANRALTSINRVRASMLPALSLGNTPLGLGTALPDIGDVGLGQVDVVNEVTEPDRRARARRTVQPVYPTAAQRMELRGMSSRRTWTSTVELRSHCGRFEPIGVFEKSARMRLADLSFARTAGR